jgi:hypothetical protein
VYLPKEGSWLCLSGTQYQKHHDHDRKLCDLILFWHFSGHKRIAVVELKGGTIRPSEVSQQLQVGAHIAVSMVTDLRAVWVAPVLVHRGRLKRIQAGEFGKYKVKFPQRKSLLIQRVSSPFDIRDADWVPPSGVPRR